VVVVVVVVVVAGAEAEGAVVLADLCEIEPVTSLSIMESKVLPLHDGLVSTSRFRSFLSVRPFISPAELAVLVVLGVCAALGSAFLDLPDLIGRLTGVSFKMPGYTILRSYLPIALGLALVPRRLAGSVMSAVAFSAGMMLNILGMAQAGIAALTCLGVTGPMLDLAVWRVKKGWSLYAGFVLAGLGSNMVAYMARGLSKILAHAHDHIDGSMLLAEWWSRAAGTYTLCGAAVGLICATAWFFLLTKTPKVSR
jgi:hypothetical protein